MEKCFNLSQGDFDTLPVYSHLKKLHIAHIRIVDSDILRLAIVFPGLESLDISRCKSLSRAPADYKNLFANLRELYHQNLSRAKVVHYFDGTDRGWQDFAVV